MDLKCWWVTQKFTSVLQVSLDSGVLEELAHDLNMPERHIFLGPQRIGVVVKC